MASRLERDPEADGWERSDFPIVCETCLGPNPYVRMQRIEYGGQCHISGRPYTVFRWRPGNEARYKKTIVCQEVAKAKNVCQVCLLDLEYGLPVQVRDTALGVQAEELPESAVGKEYQIMESIKKGETDSSFNASRANDALLRLQRTTPYYKRNMAQLCSFFVRGACTRGAECPYRHEMPSTGELAEQNITDRYYGTNDPVAKKMLNRLENMPKLEPPEDKTITTLFIGGVTDEISEEDLRDKFYAFGELASVKKMAAKSCAFVTFTARAAAEKAAEEMAHKLIVKATRLKVMWGKPREARPGAGGGAGPSDAMQPSSSGRPGAGAPPMMAAAAAPGFFNLPPPGAPGAVPYYPSMDPSMYGSRPPPRHADEAPGEGPEAKRQRMGPRPPPGPPPASAMAAPGTT